MTRVRRGRSVSRWRQFVCLGLIAYLPGACLAADTPSAILKVSGEGVAVNDKAAANAMALYPNDLIRTQKGVAARIEMTGSAVDINPETIVEYDGDELVLEHGGLTVNTSTGLRVRVGCLLVVPVNDAVWTHFDVSDVDGKLTVFAEKSDVYINERSKKEIRDVKQTGRSSRTIVHETEKKSREDKCGAGYVKGPTPAVAPVLGPILDSPWAIGIGAGAIGVVTCWALCKNDDPISPHTP